MGGWYRADRECPICKGSGEVHTRAVEMGYKRMPSADTEDRAAWLTPSGVICRVIKGHEFVLSTLCNCARERHGLPKVEIAA
jgi:hypothetical protein